MGLQAGEIKTPPVLVSASVAAAVVERMTAGGDASGASGGSGDPFFLNVPFGGEKSDSIFEELSYWFNQTKDELSEEFAFKRDILLSIFTDIPSIDGPPKK